MKRLKLFLIGLALVALLFNPSSILSSDMREISPWYQSGTGVYLAIPTSQILLPDGTALAEVLKSASGNPFYMGGHIVTGESQFLMPGTGVANLRLGIGAGTANTTGISNIALGQQALHNNTTGFDNIAIGSNALITMDGANSNIAIGADSQHFTTTGGSNVSIGIDTLLNNLTGSANTAVGTNTLRGNLGGGNNSAFGIDALYSNISGEENTAVGAEALRNNTTGVFNTAVGFNSLNAITTTSFNSALGFNSLLSATGTNNTGLGASALQSLGSGDYNTAVGYQAGKGVASGTSVSGNTLIGSNAGIGILTGADYNTLIGNNSGYTLTTGAGNVFLGNSSGYYETGNNKLFIDNQARASEADGRLKALIYGIFDANPVNQILTFNASVRGTTLISTGDLGGLVSATAFTNITSAPGANAYLVQGGQALSTVNTGWIKIYIGTNIAWVPYWQNATP